MTTDHQAWVKRKRALEEVTAAVNAQAFELFAHPLRCDCPDHDGRGME